MAGSPLCNVFVSEWTNRHMDLESASTSMQGGRETMEDGVVAWARDSNAKVTRSTSSESSALVTETKLLQRDASEKCVYEALVVCDGHGGGEASRDVLAYLPPAIDVCQHGLTAQCLMDVITETDVAMRCADLMTQGTTLSVVIAQPVTAPTAAIVPCIATAAIIPCIATVAIIPCIINSPDADLPVALNMHSETKQESLSLSTSASASTSTSAPRSSSVSCCIDVLPTDVTGVDGGIYLWIATLGDSPVLVLHGNHIVFATGEHDPRASSEAERIARAGGFVLNGRVNGRINMSRSLGNYTDKNRSDLHPHLQSMSCQADVAHVYAPPGSIIVTASDGLYERLSYKHVADFVSQMQAARSWSWSAADIALGLVEYAHASGSADNVTVVVTLVGASRRNVYMPGVALDQEEKEEEELQTVITRHAVSKVVQAWVKRVAFERNASDDATSRVERYGERPTCEEMLRKARLHIMTAIPQVSEQRRHLSPKRSTPVSSSSSSSSSSTEKGAHFVATPTSFDIPLSLPSSSSSASSPLSSPSCPSLASWVVLDRRNVPTFRLRSVDSLKERLINKRDEAMDLSPERAEQRRLRYMAGVRRGRTTSPTTFDAHVRMCCHHPPAQSTGEIIPDPRWDAIGVDTRGRGVRAAAWCASLDHMGVQIDQTLLRYLHEVCAKRYPPETMKRQDVEARKAADCVVTHCLRPPLLADACMEADGNITLLSSPISSSPPSSPLCTTSLAYLMRDTDTPFGSMFADTTSVASNTNAADLLVTPSLPSPSPPTISTVTTTSSTHVQTSLPHVKISWWRQIPDGEEKSHGSFTARFEHPTPRFGYPTPRFGRPTPPRAAYGICTTRRCETTVGCCEPTTNTSLMGTGEKDDFDDLVYGMFRVHVETAGVCLYVSVVCSHSIQKQQSWRDAYAHFKMSLESIEDLTSREDVKLSSKLSSHADVDGSDRRRDTWRCVDTYAKLIRTFWSKLDGDAAFHTHVGVLCVASPRPKSISSSSSLSSSSSDPTSLSSSSCSSTIDLGFVVCVLTRGITLDILTSSATDEDVSLTRKLDVKRPHSKSLPSVEVDGDSSPSLPKIPYLELKMVDIPHPKDAIIVMASGVHLYFVAFQFPTRAPFSDGADMAGATCLSEVMETALDAAASTRSPDIDCCVWTVSTAVRATSREIAIAPQRHDHERQSDPNRKDGHSDLGHQDTEIKEHGGGSDDDDDDTGIGDKSSACVESKIQLDDVTLLSPVVPTATIGSERQQQQVDVEPDEDEVAQYVEWVNERLARRQTPASRELDALSQTCSRLRRTFVCGIRASTNAQPSDTCAFCSDAECEDEVAAWKRWSQKKKGPKDVSIHAPPKTFSPSRMPQLPASGLWLTGSTINQWDVQHIRQLVASLSNVSMDVDLRCATERVLHAVRAEHWNAFAAIANVAIHLTIKAAATREMAAFHNTQLATLNNSINHTSTLDTISVLPFVIHL
jgi:serine/threonine protein phosphatase PrpC